MFGSVLICAGVEGGIGNGGGMEVALSSAQGGVVRRCKLTVFMLLRKEATQPYRD